MSDLAGLLLVFAFFGVVLGGLPWLASRARGRGVGGGVFDEVWHPAAHRARLETQVQEERRAPPAPSPDDW